MPHSTTVPQNEARDSRPRLQQQDLDKALRSVGGSRAVEDIYPLSPLQEGILFHCLYATDSSTYVGTVCWRLTGDLNVPALENAWQHVIHRHTILRTAFIGQDLPMPLQVVLRSVELPFMQYDWRDLPVGEQETRLLQRQDADRCERFDFANPPLMRVSVFRLAERSYQILWIHHHLVLDGWSLATLLQEIQVCYAAFCKGRQPELTPARPFRDYISWLQRQDRVKTQTYWRKRLDGYTEVAACRMGRPGSGKSPGGSARLERALSVPVVDLEGFARRHKLTTGVLLQAAWALLLSRYSGRRDVLFGLTLSGRPAELPDVDVRVGLFINTLPYVTRVQPAQSLLAWLQEMQVGQTELLEQQHSSLREIYTWERLPAGTQLFDSTLAFENYPVQQPAVSAGLPSIAVTHMEHSEHPHYPLNLLLELRERLILRVIYEPGRFEVTEIERLGRHFELLLAQMVADAHRPVGQLSMLDPAEREQLLVGWNQTAHPFARERGVHELFAEQAARTPQAVAVVGEGQSLTYGELDRRSSELSAYLCGLQVGPEAIVGVCLERSPQMVVALLGILKAGAAYLPLEPECPQERLQYMLQDARVELVLTQGSLRSRLSRYGLRLICVDDEWPQIAGCQQQQAVGNAASAQNLAYVIYTSGSTGRPKGTAIQHRSLTNYLACAARVYQVDEGTSSLVMTPLTFDATITSLFTPLICGGRISVPAAAEMDLDRVWSCCGRGEYSLVKLTPAHLSTLPPNVVFSRQGDRNVITFVVGGEALTVAQAQACLRAFPGARVVNEYGPTETVVGCTSFDVQEGTGAAVSIPIGRPLWNTQLYVLDEELEPVPVGMEGELYITGAGLARGYLHRPALTAERFIPSPFAAAQRLYRTGDRVQYRADGHLQFIGRVDQQVKVRGFRIELGEIEAVLQRHAGVRQAVVVVREGEGGQKQLIGYVVGTPGVPCAVDELRAHLLANVPEYMLPNSLVMLEELPLTVNGKVDRRRLPAPQEVSVGRQYVEARTPQERTLARIWSEVLRVGQVGIHDNFIELGGDSIRSIRMVAQATQAGIKLTLRQVFEHPTIAELAVVAATNAGSVTAEQGIVQGEMPLIPAQIRWLDLYPEHPDNYIVPLFVECPPEVSVLLLRQAFAHLFTHHDALRIRLRREANSWIQENPGAHSTPDLHRYELGGLDECEQDDEIRRIVAMTYAGVSLSGPLMIGSLMHLGERRCPLLVIAIHHFVFDQISLAIFMEDLNTVYEQLASGGAVHLLQKTTSFKIWAERLVDYSQSTTLQAQSSHWLGLPWEAARLPRDFSDGRNTLASSARVSRVLDVTSTTRLQERIAATVGVSLQAALLSGLAVAVASWAGRDKLVLSVAVNGRHPLFSDVDLTRTIGWFSSSCPVAIDVDPKRDHLGLLLAVSNALRDAPAHGVGYGVLRYSCRSSELTGIPEPELHFNFLGELDKVGEKRPLRLVSHNQQPPAPGQDRGAVLAVDSFVSGGRIFMNWDYSNQLHYEQTVEALASRALSWLQELPSS